MSLRLKSDAFKHEESIPKKYACEGENVSPPLAWSGAPDETKSFVLIVDDPDAPDPDDPKMTWVHWVLYDIPADATELPEDVQKLPGGTQEGLNDWERTGWGGPDPPKGRHRYVFKLYALDRTCEDLMKPTKDQLMQAIAKHIVDEAVLIGTYEKQNSAH